MEQSDNDVLLFQQPVKVGAGSRTRTYEARRREIYSLLSLPLDDSSTIYIIYYSSKKSKEKSPSKRAPLKSIDIGKVYCATQRLIVIGIVYTITNTPAVLAKYIGR